LTDNQFDREAFRQKLFEGGNGELRGAAEDQLHEEIISYQLSVAYRT
jgi:hypothetical protein